MKVNVVELENLNELINEPEGNLIQSLEKEYLDMTVFVDVNLSSLIENLTYNGLTEDQILEMNKAHYGDVIHFYKLKEEDIHIMLVGQQ